MAIPANFGFGIHLPGFFLEAAHKNHLVIDVQECITIFPLGEWRICLFAHRWCVTRIRLLFAFRVHSVPDPFLSRAVVTTEWRNPPGLYS